jgi:pyruvate kinase
MMKNKHKEVHCIDCTKQTKIVATIGTATEKKEVLTKLIQEGVNVIRLNMSHGDHAEHERKAVTMREINKELGAHVALLVDLAGPKIRIGDFATDFVTLTAGKTLTLSTVACVGTKERVYINYPKLTKEVRKGSIIMLNDGKQKLEVVSIKGSDVICKIIVGGDVRGRRGVNIPGAYLSVSAITAKDKKDIAFAVKQKADFVAVSFVRTAKDIETVRSLLKKASWMPRIIAKIETEEALEQFDSILQVADGIMVARGDLAVEIPKERVPAVQKKIIRKANEAGKFTITATQMLSSMMDSPVPTRAEVSDVANAIFDGTDAVMLSEESAVGRYALEAVSTMRDICDATDKVNDPRHEFVQFDHERDAIKKAAVDLAKTINAKAIIALTETGSTPYKISRFKNSIPIIAIASKSTGLNYLSLAHGVSLIEHKAIHSIPELRKTLHGILSAYDIAQKGDRVVVVSGLTFGASGSSNMVFIETL